MNKNNKIFFLIFCSLLLYSCSQKYIKSELELHDPYEQINRPIFSFNQGFDEYILEPTASAYDKLPKTVKTGVSNHVKWVSTPSTILNSGLQMKSENFALSTIKFLLNSLTFGLYDLDKETDFKKLDFGSTLANYEVSSGPYIVVPFFGPRSLRHFVGDLTNYSLSDNMVNYDHDTISIPLNIIDSRNNYSNVIRDINESQDPYIKAKVLYQVSRSNQISTLSEKIKRNEKEQENFEKLLD